MLAYRMTLHLTLTLALSLAAAQALSAQETILLKDGRSQKGWVRSDDGSRIRFEIDTGGQGEASTHYTYDQLSPRTVFRLMLARTKRDDGAAQLKLAKYALEHKLLKHAWYHYHLADIASADHGPEVDKGLKLLRQEAGRLILDIARKQASAGDYVKSQYNLTMIVHHFPEQPEAATAQALLKQVHPKAEAQVMKPFTDLARDVKKQHHDIAMHMLDEAQHRLEKANGRVGEASSLVNQQGKALTLYSEALFELKKGSSKVRQARNENKGDKVLETAAEKLDTVLVKRSVNIYLLKANIFIGRDSVNQAMKEVKMALEIDPKNAEALAMQARLPSLAQGYDDGDDGGYWWRGRTGGRYGRQPGHRGGRRGGGRR